MVPMRSGHSPERARCVQHMQKALTQMNVQLDTVLNDVMGKSGEAIVRSIVGGERDATVLARMCDRRVKARGPGGGKRPIG